MAHISIRAMLHNEEDYPEPHLFNPDRYLKNGTMNPDIRDPSTIAFGFGRRSVRFILSVQETEMTFIVQYLPWT